MKYLGIDFGLRRVGLATSDGQIASPLKVLAVKSVKEVIVKVEAVINEVGFDQIVVGLPGGKIGQTVKGFIKALRKKGLEVIETDETLSTKDALQRMIELNIPKGKRRESDAYSAAIILQKYLDEKS